MVVNDGSRDSTSAVVRNLQPEWPGLELLEHPANRGRGKAMKTLPGHASRQGAGGAVVLHAEEQYSPERIPGNLELFDRDEVDIVEGSRMAAGGNAFGTTLAYKFIADRWLTALEIAVIGPGRPNITAATSVTTGGPLRPSPSSGSLGFV